MHSSNNSDDGTTTRKRGKGESNQEKSNQETKPKRNESARVSTFDGIYSPSFKLAFLILAMIRVFSAQFNIMTDCDEVFNYWEPVHYMMYGFGFQTWEYSPEFALRSYAYTGLHVLLGWIAIPLSGGSKVVLFFYIRVLIGIISALSEAFFYRCVRSRFGGAIGNITLFFLAISSGMFLASTALLPNSFAMICILIGVGNWINLKSFSNYIFCLFSISCSVLMGTPFIIVVAVPIGIHLIILFGFLRTLGWSILCLVVWLGGSLLVDLDYYGFATCPILNTLMYNALGSGPGSQLYGVEPLSYYFRNLFVNFNLMFPFAMLMPLSALLVIALKISKNFVSILETSIFLCPLYLWLGFMFCLPHKEERFLFPVYPLICLSAAIFLSNSIQIFDFIVRKISKFENSKSVLYTLVCSLIFLISISRIIAMYNNYSAPYRVWGHVYDNISGTQNNKKMVCIGKEWYRFPSSFFTPETVRLGYISNDFTGQLPRYYLPYKNATKIIPNYFNDKNIGDPSAFVDVSECDYVVDFEPKNQVEPKFSDSKAWSIVFDDEFVDDNNSIFKSFFVPFFTNKKINFSPYRLFKKKKNTK